jgi:hypothetical protein
MNPEDRKGRDNFESGYRYINYEAEKEFHEKKIANIVSISAIVNFVPKVDIDWIFYLLPITFAEVIIPPAKKRGRAAKNPPKIKQPEVPGIVINTKSTLSINGPEVAIRKIKLPHCEPGSIIHLNHKGEIRGIMKSSKTKCFKHAIMTDISLEEKNVNVKITNKSLQISGIKKLSMIEETAKKIYSHIEFVERMCKKIRNNREAAKLIIDWIKIHSKGEMIGIIEKEINEFTGYDEHCYTHITDYFITIPDQSLVSSWISETPQVDEELYSWLISFEVEYQTYNMFIEKLEYIVDSALTIRKFDDCDSFEDLVSRVEELDSSDQHLKLETTLAQTINIKCNFVSGYRISGESLSILDGKDGILVSSDLFRKNSKIEIKYDPGNHYPKKKDKNYAHKFTVRPSGSISLASSDFETMIPPLIKVRKLLKMYRIRLEEFD